MKKKVTKIISDNRANVLKAVKIMQEEAQLESTDETQEREQDSGNYDMTEKEDNYN